MITITITEASNTHPAELRALAQYLNTVADASNVRLVGKRDKTDAEIGAKRTPLPTIIEPADLPDAGAPVLEPLAVLFAAPGAIGESLREPVIDPKVAFGAVPNVPAVPACSTAAAPALPTVPAVPQVTSIIPASVPLPPVPPVPASDAQQDEGAPSDAQFDKTGLPWDARIHSRGRSMNANGTWRSKRGVDDATVAAVVAELRAVPGVPAATLADDVATAEAGFVWPFTPPGAVPPPPPPAPAATVVSFPAFMKQYVPHIEPSGPITQAQLTAILVAHGVPNIALLSARTDLLPAVSAQLDTLIAAAA